MTKIEMPDPVLIGKLIAETINEAFDHGDGTGRVSGLLPPGGGRKSGASPS